MNRSVMSDLLIVPLQEKFLDAILRSSGGAAWHQDPQKWSRYFQEHSDGTRYVFTAHCEGQPVGYGSLVFQSKYKPFLKSDTPEINDLVVAETFRGKGIASRLITAFESEAAHRQYRQIGLGVGLYSDYGPAQRLYAKLGYVIDGLGITSHYEIVTPGSTVKVDDDLVIWLSKALSSKTAI